jgi:hypothetical protein
LSKLSTLVGTLYEANGFSYPNMTSSAPSDAEALKSAEDTEEQEAIQHLTSVVPAVDSSTNSATSKAELNQRLEDAARKAQETLEHASLELRKRLSKLSTLVGTLYEEQHSASESVSSEQRGEHKPPDPGEAASGSLLDSWRSFSNFVSAHMNLDESGYRFLEPARESKNSVASSDVVDADAAFAALLESNDPACFQKLFERYFAQKESRELGASEQRDTGGPEGAPDAEHDTTRAQRVVDAFRVALVQRYRCSHNDLTPERRYLLPGRLFITKTHVAFLSSMDAARMFDETSYETDIRPSFIRHEPIRLLLALQDVTKVQRGKGMNLRLVTSEDQSYIFGEFRSTVEFEAALCMIEQTWRSLQLRGRVLQTTSEEQRS